MARKSNKQKYLEELLLQIETNPNYIDLRSALYKEYILHLTQGKPRTIYNHYVDDAIFCYNYYKDVMKDPDPRTTIINDLNIIVSDLMKDAIKSTNDLNVLQL